MSANNAYRPLNEDEKFSHDLEEAVRQSRSEIIRDKRNADRTKYGLCQLPGAVELDERQQDSGSSAYPVLNRLPLAPPAGSLNNVPPSMHQEVRLNYVPPPLSLGPSQAYNMGGRVGPIIRHPAPPPISDAAGRPASYTQPLRPQSPVASAPSRAQRNQSIATTASRAEGEPREPEYLQQHHAHRCKRKRKCCCALSMIMYFLLLGSVSWTAWNVFVLRKMMREHGGDDHDGHDGSVSSNEKVVFVNAAAQSDLTTAAWDTLKTSFSEIEFPSVCDHKGPHGGSHGHGKHHHRRLHGFHGKWGGGWDHSSSDSEDHSWDHSSSSEDKTTGMVVNDDSISWSSGDSRSITIYKHGQVKAQFDGSTFFTEHFEQISVDPREVTITIDAGPGISYAFPVRCRPRGHGPASPPPPGPASGSPPPPPASPPSAPGGASHHPPHHGHHDGPSRTDHLDREQAQPMLGADAATWGPPLEHPDPAGSEKPRA